MQRVLLVAVLAALVPGCAAAQEGAADARPFTYPGGTLAGLAAALQQTYGFQVAYFGDRVEAGPVALPAGTIEQCLAQIAADRAVPDFLWGMGYFLCPEDQPKPARGLRPRRETEADALAIPNVAYPPGTPAGQVLRDLYQWRHSPLLLAQRVAAAGPVRGVPWWTRELLWDRALPTGLAADSLRYEDILAQVARQIGWRAEKVYVVVSAAAAPAYYLRHDGSDDRVHVAHTELLMPTDEITVEVCVRHTPERLVGRYFPRVVSKEEPDKEDPAGYCLYFDHRARPPIVDCSFYVATDAGPLRVTARVPQNRWYRVSGVLGQQTLPDARGNPVKARWICIYLNGWPEQWLPAPGGIVTTTNDLYLGVRGERDPEWPSRAYAAYLDDVRIWDRALEGEVLRRIYRAGCLVGDEPGLVGYWKLDEGPFGKVALDYSLHGHDGRLEGPHPPWVQGPEWVRGMATP